ncbi:lysophospholipid acyltransferase family protein [Lederbergia citri]|uniref:glycerol acyltransferase n=1 Tax=Lederbergia citri TaxID=2833580 RepID=UPI001F218687|nr:glycerol acyltransferase [Lederbergia citri]
MRFYGPFFRFVRAFIRIFYRRYSVFAPTTSKEPTVYIAHHQNLFGPFIILLSFPQHLHAWILDVFMNQKTCFKHYADYTFTKRFGWNRMLAKLIAWPISFCISKLLTSGRSIPVYRGSKKIIKTIELSVDVLQKGESIVIFPDIDYQDASSETKNMYDGFLYLEKYYYRKTGQHVCFVPLYASKRSRLIITGEKIIFSGKEDFLSERRVVLQKIKDNLNKLASICGDT